MEPPSDNISFLELRLGVYDAIASFNIGKNTSILIFQKQKLWFLVDTIWRGKGGGGDTAHIALKSSKILLNNLNRA